MTPAQMDEARRWVALRGWRWMPGMSAGEPGKRGGVSHFARIQRIRKDDGMIWCLHERHGFVPMSYVCGRDPIPDLTDPATRGCLLDLAREITGRPHMGTDYEPADGGHWITIWLDGRGHIGTGPCAPTESAALLAACEAHERAAWIDLAREIRLETAWTWEKAAPRSGRAKAGKSEPPIGAATAKLA